MSQGVTAGITAIFICAALIGVGYAGYRVFKFYTFVESFATRDCERTGYCAPGQR